MAIKGNFVLRFLLLSIVVFVISVYSVQAERNNVIVLDSVSQIYVGEKIGVYIAEEKLDFENARLQKFEYGYDKVPNLGPQDKEVWFKLEIQNFNDLRTCILFINNSSLEEVKLYYQNAAGAPFKYNVLGKEIPLKDRKHKSAEYMFRLDFHSYDVHTFYLSVKSDQPLILPVSVNLPNEQMARLAIKNWLNGIYFGIILIMMLYNFFIYTSVREKSYLYYVVFIGFSGLTQLMLKGVGMQYFWPNFPFLERYGVVIFASISGISGFLFTKQFLNLDRDFPRLNRLVLVSIIPFFLSILIVFYDKHLAFDIMRNATSVGAILTLCIAVYVYRKTKSQPVAYFLMAWSVLIAGSSIYLFYSFGLLEHSMLTNYSVQWSSAVEMALLSLALANRINGLEKQKEMNRLAAIELALENERIVKEQNQFLECEVAKRTIELVSKNEILNQTHENLKQAQSQLVAAEKMSSLGQLTAGIAHEINNPINFVAANVNPLRRDISEVLDILAQIEKIGIEHQSAEEKELLIKQLKANSDFDYLKTEIEFLLKGIQEGANRTADIVKGLRIFSRIDEATLKTSNINQGLESTLVISNNLLDGIRVEKDFGEIPEIYCYSGKLNQVFLNIVTNAIATIKEKFNGSTGGLIKVRTYRLDEERVCVELTDNGMGMDEHTIKKIYEPFFTTKQVGEGMGLGMSIVFSIIKEHNAEIEVNSTVGEGTTMSIKLYISNEKLQ